MLCFLLLSATQNLGESHQRPIEPPTLLWVKILILHFCFLGVKLVFPLVVSFVFFPRVEYYEGCIVCVLAYASLVVIHTKELISKDQHCECINRHSYTNEKDICIFD
jgi:hypothetical protein